MGLFQIDKQNRLVLDPDKLAIPVFKRIWDKYKDKKEAEKYIVYVYFFADLSSPYNGYPAKEREQKLKTEWLKLKPEDKLPPELLTAIQEYEDLSNTFQVRLFRAGRSACDKMATFLKELDPSDVDDKGDFVVKPTEVFRMLKELGGVSKSLKELEEQAKKEMAETSTITGGGEIGMYES